MSYLPDVVQVEAIKGPDGQLMIADGEYTKVTAYQTPDGRLFESYEEAQRHHGVLQKVRAFLVMYHPDITKFGSSYPDYKESCYIVVHANRNHDLFVDHWCAVNLGAPVTFVDNYYGSHTAVPTWKIRTISLTPEVLKKAKVIIEDQFVDPLWPDDPRRIGSLADVHMKARVPHVFGTTGSVSYNVA